MTTEPESETLVTHDMLDRKGVWGKERSSPPVSESDIRKWAIAVYWPKTPPPIFWDVDYARSTRWGGIIAPPDFNPFAWPVTVERPPKAKEAATNTPRSGKGRRGMNGGQVDTYGVPEVTASCDLDDLVDELLETRLLESVTPHRAVSKGGNQF